MTYLGRGYAIALGATFTGIAVLIYFLSKAANRLSVNYWAVVVLIAMNFLAIGSMLSSLNIVLSINIAYAMVMVLGSMKLGKKALVKAIGGVIVIALGTTVSLYLLFRDVYSDIAKLSKIAINMNSFFEYIKQVLWEPLIYFNRSRIQFNMLTYKTALIILAVCAIICLFVFFRRFETWIWRCLSLYSPAVLILMLSAAVLFFMFAQRVIFRMSLGMPRNGVFLLPLVLISSGILMDRASNALSKVKSFPLLLRSACVASLGVLCFLNFPSHRAVDVRPLDWGEQSCIGPLVRRLKRIDPDYTWKIKLKIPHTQSCNRPIRHYKRFGYKIKLVKGNDYDLWVYPEISPDSRVVLFEKKRFADHHCCIIVNTAALSKKPVLYKHI